MDYLQYFEPGRVMDQVSDNEVLYLVINGLPSILTFDGVHLKDIDDGFKPCYKWITFNTVVVIAL